MFCQVALVLLVDVSGSISDDNLRLQRQGYVDAFKDDDIVRVIESLAPVAVTIIEWGYNSAVLVDWTILETQEEIHSFSATIQGSSVEVGRGSTNVGRALEHGISMLSTVPCQPIRKVIDISGDGSDMVEPNRVSAARDDAIDKGIQINGLPIVADEYDIASWYRNNVLTPNGLLIVTNSYADLHFALRRKLLLEIANGKP